MGDCRLRLLAAAWLALGLMQPAPVKADGAALPALKADLTQSSVSGLSSGAYMAGQFEIAHSQIIVGAGIVAGGPYGCAESTMARMMPVWTIALGYNLMQATDGCMANKLEAWGIPDPKALEKRAEKLAEAGRIDPLNNLKNHRVYLYSGAADHIVAEPIVAAAREFYRLAGVPDANVVFLKNGMAGHAIVTETQGLACGVTEPPYINDCDYDQAGAILKHIYGPLNAPADNLSGEYLEFDQTAFAEGNTPPGLDKTGMVYIPRACLQTAGCRVHIVFHGCNQGKEFIGDVFIKASGYARWADMNRIIVLFPQIKSEAVNPKGCWDWWGYTQLDYMTKNAPQIASVRRMLDRLGGQ